MTADPPRRWDDDSPEEDFEANRAAKDDGLTRYERVIPLIAALEADGSITRDPAEAWSRWVVPGWWTTIPEPPQHCPVCQRPPRDPGPTHDGTCAGCRAAQDAAPDLTLLAYWDRLSHQDRRFAIAARYGTDPWSGRPAAITVEWTSLATGDDGTLTSTTSQYPAQHVPVPACSWDTAPD